MLGALCFGYTTGNVVLAISAAVGNLFEGDIFGVVVGVDAGVFDSARAYDPLLDEGDAVAEEEDAFVS